MKNKYSCGIIKDLLPLYYDNATSEGSNRIIKEHLKECSECRSFLEDINENNTEIYTDDRETIGYVKIAKKIRKRKVIISISAIILMICISAIVIKTFSSVVIAGNSMRPTILDGEKYFVNRLTYKFNSPQNLDVVIYKQNGVSSIARIMALPKEVVKIINGVVYVNDKQVNYEFLPKTVSFDKFTVRDNEYFIVKDNTEDMKKGPQFIKGNQIIGKVSLEK